VDWVWAAFAAFWTCAVAAYALWLWRAPDRWRRTLKANYFGFSLNIDPEKAGTRIWLASHKAIGAMGLAMAVIGAILTIGLLWQAMSGLFK
jgi:hypothetical protein